MRSLLFFLSAVAAWVGLSGPLAAEDFGDFRAMWVSRFEYSTSSPANVQQVISNAASMGITDVLFQVRAQADAYYDSNYEPRSERLLGTWDPLQTAVDAAQANGVRLHAWINTMPIWRGSAGPADGSHIFYNTDPSFRRIDINGVPEDPQNQNGEYASVNPILPEVHTHLNNVVQDIATNYAVDGVHLDYIRWIGSQDFNTLPHDPISEQLFQTATGLDASLPANAGAYRSYIRDRITDAVASLKSTVDAAELSTGRTIDLSAAVWRDPSIAFNERLQDYETWLEQDLLDIAVPMIYLNDSNSSLFVPNLNATLNVPTNARIAPGIGVFLHDVSGGGVDLTLSQLSTAEQLGADGATFFSYSNFFGSDPLASQRQTAVEDFYENLVPNDSSGNLSPDADLLTDFEQDEGYLGFSPTFSGSNQGIFGATAERTSEETHLGGFSQQLSITGDPNGWFLRHVSGIGGSANAAEPSGNLPLTSDGSVGLWIKTNTSGVAVSMAVDDPETADRGLSKSIVADGQWHLYQWDLGDDLQWEGWIDGDGMITGPAVTLDSLQFFGAGDAVLHLDTLAYNPLGSLAAPPMAGDYNGDGVVGPDDYMKWASDFGQAVPAGQGADGNSDTVVNAADYVLWRDQPQTGATVSAIAVPEPAALSLLAMAFFGAALTTATWPQHRRRQRI